jgi:hypothetical protein
MGVVRLQKVAADEAAAMIADRQKLARRGGQLFIH